MTIDIKKFVSLSKVIMYSDNSGNLKSFICASIPDTDNIYYIKFSGKLAIQVLNKIFAGVYIHCYFQTQDTKSNIINAVKIHI